MDLDPQWINLVLLAFILVSQVSRWAKRAEEKIRVDSMRVNLAAVFVPRELYESEISAARERIRRLERKAGINGSGQHDDKE